jgi:DNA-binding beta-propeller fold protein YncE
VSPEGQELAVQPLARLVPASGDGSGSTIALASFGDRRIALVADADSRVVRVFDRAASKELPPLVLDGQPGQLLVTDDGRVLVTVRDKAVVEVLEPSPELAFRVAQRVPTAVEPVALAATPDKRSILVASGWGRALEVFAASTMERRFRAEVAREPRAVVVSADGKVAYVAHASASVLTKVDLESPDHPTSAVDMVQNTTPPLAWRQGYALVRSDLGIIAPGVTANTGDTTVRPATYGGTEATGPAETFEVATLDSADAKTLTAPSTPCLLPRAAAYDSLGNGLFIVCQGSDRLVDIPVPSGLTVAWSVGEEPTGVALDRDTRTALVWSQLSRTISQVAMDGTADAEVKTAYLGDPVEGADPLHLGRALFSRTADPHISADGRACASCHPDGRDDGLVWSTPDGPRQTPTLAGRLAGTAPYGWNGAKSTVMKHVTSTLKRLGGSGLDKASMDAVVAYCMAMKPPPAPAKEDQDTRLVAEAAEGKALFEDVTVGCSSCHIQEANLTDGHSHDVKSKAAGDPRGKFDTPSLRFVAGTPPYFHDGRYPTLRALLRASGGDEPGDVKMGHSAQLSDHEIDALEAYLRTL